MSKTNLIITVLALLVVILGGIVAYSFVAKPFITGYAVNAQNQGIELAVVSIMQQASSCQPVPLTYGEQTINLIAVECLQQAQPAIQPTESTDELEVNLEENTQG